MKPAMLFLLLLFPTLIFAQNAVISGKITSHGEAVPYASINSKSHHIGTVSNENGEYNLQIINPSKLDLVVSAPGFIPVNTQVSIKPGSKLSLDFNLDVQPDLLDEVIIVDDQTGLTRRTPYTISSITISGIENKGNPGGLMSSLKEIPGINGAELGHGIVKPLIRGLGFSRVVTIYQGNKLENHQWGADHGLGINDLGVKGINVIKGPASVLYGSGAIGGVILSKDDDFYLRSQNFTGNAGITLNSISQGIRTYGSLGKSFSNDMFVALDLAGETHADYRDGNNRIIGNSRFNTKTLRFHTGVEKEKFQNKLSLTYNEQNLGIISDEEMNDPLSLATSRNDREMQLPFQEVTDVLVSYNQTTNHGLLETSLHLSHHLNSRKEIEENFNEVDLGLRQNHSFYNARLSLPTGNVEHSIGIQGSIIINQNLQEAKEILIPDAHIFENGLYYMASIPINSWFIQGAVRYDHRKVTAFADAENLIDYGFILPGEPANRRLSQSFSGFTGSMGVTKRYGLQHSFKLNFSTGFRAPDLAELYSYGPHPGTNRFEMGNVNFGREQSLQADLNYSFTKNRFSSSISAFTSSIDNYIFFAGTGERRQEDNLEIWAYQQTNALFNGLEIEMKHSWLKENRLSTRLTAAMVRAIQTNTKEPLTFIPPDNYSAELSYFALADKSLFLYSNLRLIMEQSLTGLNEQSTPGYTLLNMGISKKFSFNRNNFEAGISLYNALNRQYINHLSILRAFEVSSPGRNAMLNLRYTF